MIMRLKRNESEGVGVDPYRGSCDRDRYGYFLLDMYR